MSGEAFTMLKARIARICPGIQVAEATIFITVATTLAICNVSPVVENGVPVLPVPGQTSGLVT